MASPVRPGSAAALLRRVARASESFPRRFVTDATKKIATAIDKRLIGDAGGDRLLSGTNRNGRAVRLRVQRKVDGHQVVTGEVAPGPNGRPIALWSWLDRGTKPHMIGGRQHPGTAAKHTWSKPADEALAEVGRDIQREFSKVIGA